jgi:hypothetical protein
MRFPLAFVSILAASAAAVHAATFQIDCTSIFNARPVSVVQNGAVIPWRIGIDGGGKSDGFATTSAARAHGDPSDHALPDDGVFAANGDHPLVQLPYGRAGTTRPQTRSLSGESGFELDISKSKVSELLLFFTSAEGSSQLSLILHYTDGNSDTRTVEMPDYYRAPLASEKDLIALASNLAKWNALGKLAEADHHFIYGWKIKPDASRILKSITLRKNAAGYLVFWGATAETVQ